MIKFVLSLDTELAWGQPSGSNWDGLVNDPSSGRDAIQYTLRILDEYDIPATWGIVGHLLLSECDGETHYNTARITDIDPYTDIDQEPLYYAPEILDWIRSASVDHEIAGHSFTHPDFRELDRDSAKKEFEAMSRAFGDRNCELRSMIHPYTGLDHLELLSEYDISYYSGVSHTNNHTIKSGFPKLLRFDPEMITFPTVSPKQKEDGLLEIPRSGSLRDERWGWLIPLRLKRSLKQHSDGVIHLSFHPHNIIYDPHLKRILPKVASIVDSARSRGELKVMRFCDFDI